MASGNRKSFKVLQIDPMQESNHHDTVPMPSVGSFITLGTPTRQWNLNVLALIAGAPDELIPTVLIATTEELNVATAKGIIMALTNPPAGMEKDEYGLYLLNVTRISKQLKIQANQELEQNAKDEAAQNERFEDLRKERRRIERDHTNVLRMRDRIRASGYRGEEKEVAHLERSIRERYQLSEKLMHEVQDGLGKLGQNERRIRDKMDAILYVCKWIGHELDKGMV